MSRIFKGAAQLIGNTPLLEAVNIEKDENLNADIVNIVKHAVRGDLS